MPGPSSQNVAHVRPMPQLIKKSIQPKVPKSTSGSDLLKNPSQLYQMVSLDINGVHKKVMVPVSSPAVTSSSVMVSAAPGGSSRQVSCTSLTDTSQSSSISTIRQFPGQSRNAPVTSLTTTTQSIGKVGPAPLQCIGVSTSVGRGRGRGSSQTVASKLQEIRRLSTNVATKSVSASQTKASSLLGAKCILANSADGSPQLVILPTSTGSQPQGQSILVTKQSVSTLNVQNSLLSSMPKFTVASSSTPSSKTVASTVNVPTTQPINVSKGPDGPVVTGYLIGNQLVLAPNATSLPNVSGTLISNAMTHTTPVNIQSADKRPLVTSSANNHTVTSVDKSQLCTPSIAFTSNKPNTPLASSGLKIETVFSLQKNLESGTAQPDIIEIKPDSDEEENVDYQVPSCQLSSTCLEGPASQMTDSITSQLPKPLNTPQLEPKSERTASPASETSSSSETECAILSQTEHYNTPQVYGTIASETPVSRVMSIVDTLSKLSTSLDIEETGPILKSLLHGSNEGVDMAPSNQMAAGKKQVKARTARKSTSLPHRRFRSVPFKPALSKSPADKSQKRLFPKIPFEKVTLKVGKDGKSINFCSFEMLRDYFPTIRNCQVKLLKLPANKISGFNTTRVSPRKKAGIQPFDVADILGSQKGSSVLKEQKSLSAEYETLSKKFDTDPSAAGVSKVFSSQGQSLKVTQTGRKTVFQPSLTGADKGKFLMIKTNAGTFLVPVNQSDSKVSGVVSSVDKDGVSMKILPPFSEVPAGKDEAVADSTSSGKSTPEPLTKPKHIRGLKSSNSLAYCGLTDSPSSSRAAHKSTSMNMEPEQPYLGEWTKSPKKRRFVEEDFAKAKKAAKTVESKDSGSDRIRMLKEMLQMQEQEAKLAKQVIEKSKHVLDQIDLDS